MFKTSQILFNFMVKAGLEKNWVALRTPHLKWDVFTLPSTCRLALAVYRWVSVYKKGPLADPTKAYWKRLVVTF